MFSIFFRILAINSVLDFYIFLKILAWAYPPYSRWEDPQGPYVQWVGFWEKKTGTHPPLLPRRLPMGCEGTWYRHWQRGRARQWPELMEARAWQRPQMGRDQMTPSCSWNKSMAQEQQGNNPTRLSLKVQMLQQRLSVLSGPMQSAWSAETCVSCTNPWYLEISGSQQKQPLFNAFTFVCKSMRVQTDAVCESANRTLAVKSV